MLLPIGHYEADRRREKLLEDIEKFMRQAAEVELRTWRDEVVKKHAGSRAEFPLIVNAGELGTLP